MKRTALLVLCGWVLSGSLSLARAQNEIEVVPPSADAKVYGEYPAAYKEIITRWMETRLVDPPSAVFEWLEPPKPGEVPAPKGTTQRLIGYVVDFKVNARNRFGAPTGKRKYRAVIRNGEVLWGGSPRS